MSRPRKTVMAVADFWKNYPGPKLPMTEVLNGVHLGYGNAPGTLKFDHCCLLVEREDVSLSGKILKSAKFTDIVSWHHEREFLRNTRRWMWTFRIDKEEVHWKSLRHYMEGIKSWRRLSPAEVPNIRSLQYGMYPSIPEYCNKCKEFLCDKHM